MEATAKAPTTSPAVSTSNNANREEILRIYQAQQKNLAALRATSIKDRIKKLKLLEKTVLEYRSKIGDALYNDFRKSHINTDFSEIYPVVAECRLFTSKLYDWLEPEEVDTPLVFVGANAKIILEPKGRTLRPAIRWLPEDGPTARPHPT